MYMQLCILNLVSECIGKLQALDLIPKKIHERSPVFLGSYDDIEQMKELYAASKEDDY